MPGHLPGWRLNVRRTRTGVRLRRFIDLRFKICRLIDQGGYKLRV
jgi:hypothetical protein